MRKVGMCIVLLSILFIFLRGNSVMAAIFKYMPESHIAVVLREFMGTLSSFVCLGKKRLRLFAERVAALIVYSLSELIATRADIATPLIAIH